MIDGAKERVMRVVQWGVGNVGRHSLRAILERPELELVGLRVYTPDKVGRDAGEFVDSAPTGVTSTDNIEDILALEADCVLYNGLGSALVDLTGPVDDLARLLESGKNVVSSALDAFVYLKSGIAVTHVKPQMIERLEEACEAGATTIYSTGMTPGFATDLWPITMSRVSRRVESLRVTEIVNLRDYESTMMPIMGFGLHPGAPSLMHDFFEQDPAGSVYVAPMHMVADSMRMQIDDVTYDRQVIVAEDAISVPSGDFAAGTVVGIRFQFIGWVGEKPFFTLDFVWRAEDTVAPDWPAGHCAWTLEIEGDPSIRSSMELATPTDAKRPTSLTVAMNCLNAVPVVVAAPPGIANHLALPPFAGRGVGSLRPVGAC
jgi:hypothetical protein